MTLRSIPTLAVAVAPLMAVPFVAGCNDGVCERPAEARDIVSDGQIERFQEAGVDFHCGDDTPDIAGTYAYTDAYVAYHDDEDIIDSTVCNAEYTILATEDPAVYDVTRELTSCAGEAETVESYMSGDGDCFTLYSVSEGVFEGCEVTNIGIFTGCVAEGGIDVPQWAGLATRREGEACESLYEQGRTAREGQVDAIALESEFLERTDD